MIELIFFITAAGLCWCLALSKAVRAKMRNPWWIKSMVNTAEDQQVMTDILFRVIGVVGGLIFSLLAITVLVRTLP